jgi:CBS-domain-containing membrane protein
MAPTGLQVKDVMSREVHIVNRNDELGIADALMKQERVRHLPALDADGEVSAVVSQRELFRGALLRALGFGSRAEELMLKQVAVKEAMSSENQATAPDTARLVIEWNIGCLPVTENGKLVGIVTETDFVRLVSEGR